MTSLTFFVFSNRMRRTSRSLTSSVRMSLTPSPRKCLLTTTRKCRLSRCQVGWTPHSSMVERLRSVGENKALRYKSCEVSVQVLLKLVGPKLTDVSKSCSRQRDRNGPFATDIGAGVATHPPTSDPQDASHTWTPGPQQDAAFLPRHEGEQNPRRTGEAARRCRLESVSSSLDLLAGTCRVIPGLPGVQVPSDCSFLWSRC